MGIKRMVDVGFWTDDKVIDMFTPEDKLFMLYLMTNPHTTQLGIYSINPKVIAFEIGYSTDSVKVLIDRFENKYNMVKYSYKTKEIAIKNYLKYSIIKGGKPVEDLLLKEIANVKDIELLLYVYRNLEKCNVLNETVKKVLNSINLNEKQNDDENDNENDNDNDNDNEESLTNRQRIVDESQLNVISDEYQNIKEEILSNKESKDKICEWCKCKTSVLHKHHYPIPKRLGGKETVNICSNCHNEFHVRESKKFSDNHGDLIIKNETEISESNFINDVCNEIVSRLNELTGSSFRSDGKATKDLIKNLLKDYSKEDILIVVDKMCYKWGNDSKMSEFLRPSTLFRRSNFENYLGMKVQQKEITTKDIAEYMDFSEFGK